jgi:hypothetical protein
MLEGIGGYPSYEDFEAAVAVAADRSSAIDAAAQGSGGRPSATRSRLPYMPEGAVPAPKEDLEAAVLVHAYDRNVGERHA